jgi:hypothetical protein
MKMGSESTPELSRGVKILKTVDSVEYNIGTMILLTKLLEAFRESLQ